MSGQTIHTETKAIMKTLPGSTLPPAPSTRAVRSGIDTDSAHGAVMPPVYLSANYSFEALGQKRDYDYSRTGNPGRDQFADALAGLEGGSGAVVTGSGMSAVTLVVSLLQPRDRVLVPHNCYGGCHRLFDSLSRKGHFEAIFVDFTQPGELAAACERLEPAMIWVETPSNPLLRITDIQAVSTLARRHGALLVVDNTFLSPALQQPIALGADLVVHSTTKFINGHSDVIGGAVVARTPELHEELAWWANCLGLTASAFDCYLAQRGLRTLHARLRVHEENTRGLLDVLAASPVVEQIHHPGLACHPDHELAGRQQSGFGSIISFELSGGAPAVAAFVDALQFFTLAESLGGVESLVCHPASMTHAAMEPQAQERAGISDRLVRISVGIEHLDDLSRDLCQALEAAGHVSRPVLEVVAGC
jgi:cystathionine gamma-synthase